MKKKKKVNKRKLYSRIFLLVTIVVLIVIAIKNINGKSKDQKNAISVIIDGENVTNALLREPYLDKDNVLYLSLEDMKEFFDKSIFYESDSKKIITTSKTKVAAINVENNILELNSANLILSTRNFKSW